MPRRGAFAALHVMSGPENQDLDGAIERLRAEMERGFGVLRAEMIDRNATLLKWLLLYAVTQMAAIAALLRLFR